MSFNITSDGSPTPRKGLPRFGMTAGDLKIDTSPEVLGQAVGGMSHSHHPFAVRRAFGSALTANSQGAKRPQQGPNFGTQNAMPQQMGYGGFKVSPPPLPIYYNKHAREIFAPRQHWTTTESRTTLLTQPQKKPNYGGHPDPSITEALLQRLNGRSSPNDQTTSSNGSVPITPAVEEFNSTPPSSMDNSVLLVDSSELQRLKAELAEARNEVTRMNQEMHSHQVARLTMDHLCHSSEADYGYSEDVTEQTLTQLQDKFNAATRMNNGWGNGNTRPSYTTADSFGSSNQNQHRPPVVQPQFQRNTFLNEPTHFPLDQCFRGNGLANSIMNGMSNSFTASMNNNLSNPPTRPSSAFDVMYSNYNYPNPVGTMPSRLSPDASEFNVVNSMSPSPWNSQAASEAGGAQYVHPVEPMNYRRLLDRNMSCNWKYIVDKIICNNDQQASIFLQQKLKVGTPEQKYEIVEAIISQAYPLMVNRFGNFLVQRCFEHGTADQIIAIAQAIRGNTLALSMDAFGCHVIQKAFDCVPEEYKATMVHELLRRIPETVIHRYACHVWQKLFELRWSDSPPQIMRYVNEALRGMWHEVALGETGSLVVQNIFENCLEEDKRPCINEVLASIDVIAHGQFGNWCIQHICEHGAPSDRSRAIDHILRFATEYSMDQYASKVIEKCLKIGGPDFLDRYLERVCEGRHDRPRMPLIDIAGDQFGNYLIQYILTNSSPQHREVVGSHIRKHMVSLRGSKYGSRVAMLCCNPTLATRPGPPTGMNPRYGGGNPTQRTTSAFSAFR